jgi:ketosteroid isomerase-like protein
MSDIATLLAKQEIVEVLHRYARGIDRCDEALLRSCFHEDATHDHGFQGRSQDFCAYALKYVGTMNRSAHMVTNILIELKGDRAACECHFMAHLRSNDAKGEKNRFVKGRYLDLFEKRGGAWKIARRTGLNEFAVETGAIVAGSGKPEPGKQPDDPLYALLASL